MRICDGCKKNIEREMSEVQVLFEWSCYNKPLLEENCISMNCLQLFAIHLLKKDLDTYMDIEDDEVKII